MFKTLADFIGAIIGTILVLPVVLLAAILIVLLDRQNPFFLQARLGKFKRTFTIVKLRTMKDTVITPFGKILRKTGLDELPQLVNILLLQMSFVGPRPITLADAERLQWTDNFHAIRWNSKPGLTGLAQLAPNCHRKMSWFLDKKYVLCRSAALDIKIILASTAVLFVGKTKAIKWLHSNRNNESSS